MASGSGSRTVQSNPIGNVQVGKVKEISIRACKRIMEMAVIL